MIQEHLRMAIANLLHRRTRSWLTLIGIFIGIAAVVALVSLGQGLQLALTSEFLQLGADKLQIQPKSVGFSMDSTKNDLRDRDLRAIDGASGVMHSVGVNMQTAKVEWGKDGIGFFYIIGTTDDPVERKVVTDYWTIKLAQGRDLKQGDSAKAVVGYDLAKPDKLDTPIKIGDKLLVNGARFEVVGTFQQMGDPAVDNGVFVSDDGYQAMFGVEDRYNIVVVQAEPGADIDDVADAVSQELRRERNLDVGDENFEVQTPQELIDSFSEIFNIVQFVIYGIAAISLLVGGIGIMNTMYTAVLERTKEIGIMKAIGATNGTILSIFVLESGLLGLVGGAIGVVFGMGLAKITEYIGRTVLDTLLLQAWFSWWLVLGALLFAFITGVGSGLLPARQASKQQPVVSLRYE
jgi:putative ABC transport system permease protein